MNTNNSPHSKDSLQNSKQDASYGVVVVVPPNIESEAYRFLLVQHQKQHWDFPKGHAEAGETPLEAALREVAEETGLQVSVPNPNLIFFEHYSFRNPQGATVDKTVQFFLGQPIANSGLALSNNSLPRLQIQELELQDAQWLTAVEAMRLITFPAGRELLTQVVAHLESHPLQ